LPSRQIAGQQIELVEIEHQAMRRAPLDEQPDLVGQGQGRRIAALVPP
jgi:hypothetical protein